MVLKDILTRIGHDSVATKALILICFAVCGAGTARGRRDDLIVKTEKGLVRGVRYHLPSLGKSVDGFLGIPFAKPPVGHLRFKHPQPMDDWSGIYNATKLPNTCYQSPDEFFGPDFKGSNMWNPNTRVSEDCLYLNIWVPRTSPRLRKSAVFAWIYGGGFYSGTTTLNLYDGKILAAMNDIIVVSIGYRVGALGFLALGHPSAPGNAGMFDQLMGLEWIQQNIHFFGGNPNNVTLFGESAGSVSVSLHLLSALSRSKFQRAIMQSGTANMPWGTATMEEGRRRSLELAFEVLNCDHTTDMARVTDCLRNIPPQKLVDEQWVTRGIMQFPFLPVIDGAFLDDTPEMILARKTFKKCPVLLGSNANEATFFLPYELYEFLTLDSVTMTRKQFMASVARLFQWWPQFPDTINSFGREAILYQYTHWLDPDDTDYNIANLDRAVSDAHFVCHVNEFANAYAEAGENVYSYFFTHRYSSNPWPSWMGVLHADEINFVFGDPFKPGLNYTRGEREFSRVIMRYWVNFAKTGDPNRAPGLRSLNEWPLHTPNGKEYLELHEKYLNEPDKSKPVGRGPRSKECAFWKDYLPKLVAATTPHERSVEQPTANASCSRNAAARTGGAAANQGLTDLIILSTLLAFTLNMLNYH